VQFEWDEAKRASNLAKHGVDFARVADFDWETAVIRPDLRRRYGELRLKAAGRIDDRVHILIFTRRGQRTRVISLRKANDKEIAAYEKAP
jgi:uncharacterized DUF497 family protein